VIKYEEKKNKSRNLRDSACVCLDSGYGNEIRNKFIEAGKEVGFEKVEIIDRNTALFFDTIYKTENKLKTGDFIWILYSKTCYIWQKKCKFQFFYLCCEAPKKIMSALKENGHHAKTPEIIFNRSKSIEMNELKILFPTCLTLTGNEMPNWAKGALVKAEIMAGNCNFKQFDATTVLGHDLTVTYGNDEIFLLPFFTSLPLQRSITLQKSDDENVLKVKRITSYVINLPNCKQFNLELSVDTNGIHIVEITPLNNLFEAGTCFENIKSCIGVDIKRGEISAYSMTSKEELKISFNLCKLIILFLKNK
uniref:Uncharacterized protein n=1 Tax=Panagrolaimus sp. ES5 TaxID=591445 RepID=A0AC34GG73_9BILA